MSEKFTFKGVDYAILGMMLAISAAIGVFFRIFGRDQKTNEEYLLAGRNMSIFPVAFSLMATFMTAATIMGVSSEMYVYGTNLAFMNIGFLLGPIISAFIFLPLYFNTGVSTAYEYLERRFGKSTRRILSIIFLLQTVLFNGVVLYAPSLALSAVTNLSIWMSVVSIGAVSTFYSTLGGMKAVLWTHVFQALLMYACLLSIIIKGCLDLGGLGNIFKSAYEGGRFILPTFDIDFSVRYTMWSIVLYSLIITMYVYGTNQMQIQRLLTLKNLRRSKIASIVSAPMLVTFQLLCCLCGLIFYAHFKTCDPMTSPAKPIDSADQLMPYYITLTMREYPGLSGLCISGIFSASLSCISSGVNSMAAVTYEDIIRPSYPNLKRSVLITKTATVFYGALSIFITYLVSSLGNLVKATVLMIGMVAGPALGVHLLAALTTTANEMGTNIGVISGFLLAGCMTFIPNSEYYPVLPVGKNCSATIVNILNISTTPDTTPVNVKPTMPSFPVDEFPISFMWISSLSLVVCVVVGYFASWIISCFQGKSENVPPELLSPIRQWFYNKEIPKEENKEKCDVPAENTSTKL